MALAQAFLSRARMELSSAKYGEVLELIQQFDEVNDSPVEVSLYCACLFIGHHLCEIFFLPFSINLFVGYFAAFHN